MSFQIVKKDIREIRADAVVLPADPEHPAGELVPGHVAEGRSEEFSARHVLYAACPEWTGGSTGECKTLHSCYSGALLLASDLSCRSIAFPLLAEGGCGFPEEEAFQTALAAIRFFLLSHDMKVILAVPDREKLKLPRNLDREVQCFPGFGATGITGRKRKLRWPWPLRLNWIFRKRRICCPGPGLRSLRAVSLT